ncbi:MAG: nitroreductase family protein [Candidatus Rokubacteria bacterium]|nr:nitroreductase family protein [Candidatus Rokubacteria bacterium]MBI3826090.1 nitroreductase family protein [Candidatus Rokubacteria bacterium]
MEVVRLRMTNRGFARCEIPREHHEMILEAARHAPSGANAQPWHYVSVTDPDVKRRIGVLRRGAAAAGALAHGFPTPCGPFRSSTTARCASAHRSSRRTSAGSARSTRSSTGAASIPPGARATRRSTSGSGPCGTRRCTATSPAWTDGGRICRPDPGRPFPGFPRARPCRLPC